ncbi:MAG TPA: ABC transporter substrate-binding protein [Candidatus Sulfopaludibacter sp.]|nr:ABC transporter substrate-binding protein [Candidatus Sulfopaludibacter sp.]
MPEAAANAKSPVWTRLKNQTRKPVRFVVSTVLMALFGTVVVVRLVVNRVSEWITGPSGYVIYLVGDFTNSPKHDNIRKGFYEGGTANWEVDHRKVSVVEYDDQGDLLRARSLAAEIAARPDTLMVVGHMRSTNTKEALPFYARQSSPIPVVLTTETNPDLSPPRQQGQAAYPIVRLSATDREQAADAVRFALSKGAKFFWVVEDTYNPVYSHYLALEFIKRVQQEKGRVVLWSTNLSPPSADLINKMSVDCVFFAGVWYNALVTIRQIEKVGSANPGRFYILSDASAEKDLVTQGAGDIGERVYVLNPMRAQDSDSEGGGYRLYGRDARTLVDTLMRTLKQDFPAHRRANHTFEYYWKALLDMHRAADARDVLYEVISGNLARIGADTGGEGAAARDEGFTRPNGSYSINNRAFNVWQAFWSGTQGGFREPAPAQGRP